MSSTQKFLGATSIGFFAVGMAQFLQPAAYGDFMGIGHSKQTVNNLRDLSYLLVLNGIFLFSAVTFDRKDQTKIFRAIFTFSAYIMAGFAQGLVKGNISISGLMNPFGATLALFAIMFCFSFLQTGLVARESLPGFLQEFVPITYKKTQVVSLYEHNVRSFVVLSIGYYALRLVAYQLSASGNFFVMGPGDKTAHFMLFGFLHIYAAGMGAEAHQSLFKSYLAYYAMKAYNGTMPLTGNFSHDIVFILVVAYSGYVPLSSLPEFVRNCLEDGWGYFKHPRTAYLAVIGWLLVAGGALSVASNFFPAAAGHMYGSSWGLIAGSMLTYMPKASDHIVIGVYRVILVVALLCVYTYGFYAYWFDATLIVALAGLYGVLGDSAPAPLRAVFE